MHQFLFLDCFGSESDKSVAVEEENSDMLLFSVERCHVARFKVSKK